MGGCVSFAKWHFGSAQSITLANYFHPLAVEWRGLPEPAHLTFTISEVQSFRSMKEFNDDLDKRGMKGEGLTRVITDDCGNKLVDIRMFRVKTLFSVHYHIVQKP